MPGPDTMQMKEQVLLEEFFGLHPDSHRDLIIQTVGITSR